MEFLFFAKGDRSTPSSRYRAFYLAEALASLGHTTEVIVCTDYSIRAFFRYLRALLFVQKGSVIYLQRTIYNKYFFAAVLIAYTCGRRFIFDIDDAVYEHSPRKSALLARMANCVTCGSEAVLEWARHQNARVSYLPNGLPLSIYTMRTREPEGIPVVGWIGSGPAHFENLSMLPPIFSKLLERNVPFKFLLVGAVGDARIHELFASVPGLSFEIIDTLNWGDPKEAVREIQRFSVGIMPLLPTSWNQAKYFKALECMACGVPVVASAADALAQIFTEGGCGSLARDEKDWVESLERLLMDTALRAEEGRKGRSVVEQGYSSEAMARMFLNVVR